MEQLLAEGEKLAKPQRRSALLLFEELQRRGYQGAYDSVRRQVKAWKAGHRPVSDVFIPLYFEPGEAFQFDWGAETLILGGRSTKVSIAHVRLCHSRLPICLAYLRESLEMVMDAHRQAFAFFGGVCRRGIYDNVKTVVTKILRGKERTFNPRFLALAAHYLFEPVACTPAAGWEKTVYDPWHYLPVLDRKPGALRNGEPFKGWDLPAPIQTVWKVLKERPGGDREFVDLLNAIKTHGCEAVERAAREAIALGAISFDVIFNLLSRQMKAPSPLPAEHLPEHLTIRSLPIADCGRYDRLLEGGSHAS